MLTGISDLCSLWPDGGGCAVKMGGPTAHVLGGEAVLNLGMLRSKQRYSHKRHLRNQQNPSWNVTTKQRERPNPLNFKKHPKHIILVGMSKFCNNTEFERSFPTCQVRVVRFYVRLFSSSFSSFFSFFSFSSFVVVLLSFVVLLN